MSAILAIGCWVMVVVAVFAAYAWDVLRDLFATHDRRAHIAECSSSARLCSGVALEEAMALQLDELRGLPEIEPFRWVG